MQTFPRRQAALPALAMAQPPPMWEGGWGWESENSMSEANSFSSSVQCPFRFSNARKLPLRTPPRRGGAGVGNMTTRVTVERRDKPSANGGLLISNVWQCLYKLYVPYIRDFTSHIPTAASLRIFSRLSFIDECTYLSIVMAVVACPKISERLLSSNPASMQRVAKVCLKV